MHINDFETRKQSIYFSFPQTKLNVMKASDDEQHLLIEQRGRDEKIT